MTTAKQRFPSLASTISALGIVLYCVGFLRVELELNNYKKRLNAVENVAKSINPPSSYSIFKFNARGMYSAFLILFTDFRISCSLKGFFFSTFLEVHSYEGLRDRCMLSCGKQHRGLGGLSYLDHKRRIRSLPFIQELSFPKKGKKCDFFREPDV